MQEQYFFKNYHLHYHYCKGLRINGFILKFLSYIFSVPELEDAFKLNGDDFVLKYGFPKPSKDVSRNLVIGCRSGRRAITAFETLNKMGYASLR